MAGPKRKTTPSPGDSEITWPGNGAVLELLSEISETGKRNEAGINLVSSRLNEIEKDLVQIKQNVGGVMELGGSVLDAKEQMEKSLRGVKSELTALTKAQIRTYDLIQSHAQQTATAAHAPVKAVRK